MQLLGGQTLGRGRLISKKNPSFVHQGWGLNTRTEDAVAPLSHLQLTLSLLALDSPQAVLGVSHLRPLLFFYYYYFFFLALLRNITLATPKTGCFLCATEAPQKGRFSWCCPVLEPQSHSVQGESGVFGHLFAAQAMALSLWVLHGTQSPTRWCQFLVCSFFFIVVVLVLIPLAWPEAELNFCSAARHDRAAGSYPGAELAPLFVPNAR